MIALQPQPNQQQQQQQCRDRGICSAPTCERPIDGWCLTHGAGTKLCFVHLLEHTVTAPDGNTCRFHMLIPPPSPGGARSL